MPDTRWIEGEPYVAAEEFNTTRTPLADVDTSRYDVQHLYEEIEQLEAENAEAGSLIDRLRTDRAVLLDALRDAIDTIHVWHSAHDPDDAAWDIYREHAPEMKRLTAAVAKAERA